MFRCDISQVDSALYVKKYISPSHVFMYMKIQNLKHPEI